MAVYRTLSPQNCAAEHICCAFSDKKSVEGTRRKKDWLMRHHGGGYRFVKLEARGKVLIEYCPSRLSWLPIDAPDMMVINCFWVSGQFKGQGHGKALLAHAEAAAAGMAGLVAVAGDKKRPYMSDAGFLKAHGFYETDSSSPYFRLLFKPLQDNVKVPRFLDTARTAHLPDSPKGLHVFYSDTCPFTAHWNEKELVQLAAEKGLPLSIKRLMTREEGRAMPVPWIINAAFLDGRFLTHEIDLRRALAAL